MLLTHGCTYSMKVYQVSRKTQMLAKIRLMISTTHMETASPQMPSMERSLTLSRSQALWSSSLSRRLVHRRRCRSFLLTSLATPHSHRSSPSAFTSASGMLSLLASSWVGTRCSTATSSRLTCSGRTSITLHTRSTSLSIQSATRPMT